MSSAAGKRAPLPACPRRDHRGSSVVWTHGCRNPFLADAYASMLALDRRTRSVSHLTQALEVCEAALALQGARQARIWRDMVKRRDRLAVLAANPPQPKKRVRPSLQRNRRPDPLRRFALE